MRVKLVQKLALVQNYSFPFVNTHSCFFFFSNLNFCQIIMKPWEVEGISTDDKYDIEEYADMMKAFTAAATEGNLEQVSKESRELKLS